MHELIRIWTKYREQIATEPYDRDLVQSWGMAFSYHWNQNKDQIISILGIKEEDFSYVLALKHMPQIMEAVV